MRGVCRVPSRRSLGAMSVHYALCRVCGGSARLCTVHCGCGGVRVTLQSVTRSAGLAGREVCLFVPLRVVPAHEP